MDKRVNEKGVALIFAVILVLILSVMGVSIMFLSQSETWSSLNYRMMTQARYGAEAGLNTAANYIVNNYTAPTTLGTDPLSNYDMTKSPVQFGGNPVVLSTTQSLSNYPIAAIETAFQTAAQGSLTDGKTTVSYTASATLIAMSQVTTAGGPVTVQTWSITADGSIGGAGNALEEVTGIIERQVTFGAVPAPSYGLFATGNQCGSLTLSGGITIESYDSKHANLTSKGVVIPDAYDGNIGSNGNLNESGGAVVDGTMSTPRTGVGNCASGGVDAWSDSGKATVSGCTAALPAACVTGGLVNLPQAVVDTAPALPSPLPPTTNIQITKNSTCSSLGLSVTICSGVAGSLILGPGTYGNIALSGGALVTLSPGGSYSINSISLAGNSTLSTGANNAIPAIVNIAGQGQANPLNFSGGGVTNVNSTGVPSPVNLQFLYAGTQQLNLVGGSQTAATVYAPNAPISLAGGSNWYGSLVGSTINDSGGVNIYYDRQLSGPSSSNPIATVGNFMMDSFSWSRF